MAQLSQQLRRFLDDQAWLENRRIMDLLRGIEAKALAVRDEPPPKVFTEIAGTSADIELPMERPLFAPSDKPRITSAEPEAGSADVDISALYSQIVVDKARLAGHIRRALRDRPQVTLRELCTAHPLEHGLAELVAYLQLAAESFSSVIDESATDTIVWPAERVPGVMAQRQAHLPRVVFVR